MLNYYILFESHEQAVRLHGEFRQAGIQTAISPTPRAVTVCCGVSLLVRETEIDRVRDYLATHTCTYKSVERLEQEFNPHRDRYI